MPFRRETIRRKSKALRPTTFSCRDDMQDIILREGQAGNDIALYPGARPTVDIWMTSLPDVTLAPARREVSRWVPAEGPHEIGTYTSTIPIPAFNAVGFNIDALGAYASTIPITVQASAGQSARSGYYSSAIPMPVMASSGKKVDLGLYASTIPIPTFAATGKKVDLGPYASSIPIPTILSSGLVVRIGVTGTYASVIPISTFSATISWKEAYTFDGRIVKLHALNALAMFLVAYDGRIVKEN